MPTGGCKSISSFPLGSKHPASRLSQRHLLQHDYLSHHSAIQPGHGEDRQNQPGLWPRLFLAGRGFIITGKVPFPSLLRCATQMPVSKCFRQVATLQGQGCDLSDALGPGGKEAHSSHPECLQWLP